MMIAAMALAGAALAAAPGGGPGISVSPASVSGTQYSVATFQVRDTGDTHLSIKAGVTELRPVKSMKNAWVPWQPYRQATVTPESFSLSPGQMENLTVTVHSTDGYRHDLAVNAIVKANSVKAGAGVQTIVAPRYVVQGNPNPYQTPVNASPQTGEGFPWEILAFGAAGLGTLYAGWKLRNTRIHVTRK